MKKLNLYLDFEFTSLSPDAQPISIGIVSDECESSIRIVEESLIDKSLSQQELSKFIYDNKLGKEIKELSSKQFYAEFTDFDINRCDDWVKENVVAKLQFNEHYRFRHNYGNLKRVKDNARIIKTALLSWLEQFSDYNIQVVVDCGTWDWYHFLQLVAEWDKIDNSWHYGDDFNSGLPKLPSNISPVPQDLNDIIAIKKGISPKEAFDLNREVLAFGWHENQGREMVNSFKERELEFFGLPKENKESKHNSLWDAKIIKEIYQKLIQ